MIPRLNEGSVPPPKKKRFVMKKLLLFTFCFLLTGCGMTYQQVISTYNQKSNHRALALASNNENGASWGRMTVKDAIDSALTYCEQAGGVECKIVSVNGLKKDDYKGFSTGSGQNSSSSVADHYTCSELSESEAYLLLLGGHTYLDKDGDGDPCEWGKKSYTSKKSYTPSSRSGHWVKGYRRKNGTYVRGHYRRR